MSPVLTDHLALHAPQWAERPLCCLPQHPGSPGLTVAPQGGSRPSRIGETESQALGNLQDPSGPISGTGLQEAPGGRGLAAPLAPEHMRSPVQDAPARCWLWGHMGSPRTALLQGPPAQNERDGQTEARHTGPEEGLWDRCPGHALRQINLVTAISYQKETGTLYFLPPIPSDKIRDWVSVCGSTRIVHAENREWLSGETGHHRQRARGGSSSSTSGRRATGALRMRGLRAHTLGSCNRRSGSARPHWFQGDEPPWGSEAQTGPGGPPVPRN